MRNTITKFALCAAVLALTFTWVSDVQAQKIHSTSTAALVPGTPSVVAPGEVISTEFEAVEGFGAGPCGGQAGWTMFAASAVEGHIDAANPSTGAQHLRISGDPAVGTGNLTGCFSPNLGPKPPGFYSIVVNLAISATGGADYDVVPQAPSQSFLTARVKFNFGGNIFVLDDPGGGLTFVDTGKAWSVGPYQTLRIDIDSIANTINYYYGGALLYTSVAGVFAGTSVEQVVLLSDNFQINDSGDFDNLLMFIALPVELTNFQATALGDEVDLLWETASETDNAGFYVEMSRDQVAWQEMDFVEGFGTTLETQRYTYRVKDLEPGTYAFRLKQVDFDGSFEYSDVVESTIDVPGKYVLTEAYPNPFNPSASIRFAVHDAQPVVMAMYNMQGQHVRTLYQGTPEANEMQTVQIDGSGLPSGFYMVQLIGANFQDSKSVTLLK